MKRTFRPFEPNQMFLIPPALQDWLPKNHLAYFVSELVDELDLSSILLKYGDEVRGNQPYHPAMLTQILIYAYCVGVPSSRKIAKRCEEDVAFRILAANNFPDFRTISDFRKRHLKALKGLFVEVLRLCRKAGLVKLGHVALDGTKVKANASRHKAMSYGRMVVKEKDLEAEVEALLRQAEEMDEEEDRLYGKDRRGDELPKELAFREARLKKIREAKKALEEEAQEAARSKAKAQERPVFGQPLKPQADPVEPMVSDKAQRNFTDPESRIMMSGSTKSFEQAYNCQAAVDSTAQVIVACEVTQEPNDKQQLERMFKHVHENVGRYPKQASADAGYWSEEKIRRLSSGRTEWLVPPNRVKHGEYRQPCKRGRIAAEASWAERMSRKLRTKRGRAAYSKRKETVEPVFGQIKQGRGFRQFLMRGKEKVSGEWSLICMTHNILKLWKHSSEAADKGKKVGRISWN